MHCLRYQESLTDVAAGALDLERESALRAHLEACAPCRAALEAERQLFAAIDLGVAASVAANPSADFAARVHRLIAQEPVRARPWFAGLWVTAWAPAAALALAVLILTVAWFAWHAPARHAPPDSARNLPGNVPAKPQAGSTPSAEGSASTRAQAEVAERAAGSRSGSPRFGHPMQSVPAQVHEPQALVPPGERAAVLQLYAALQSHRVDASSIRASPATATAQLDIEPLEIAQLGRITKLEIEGRQ
jgi:hypothetical protein